LQTVRIENPRLPQHSGEHTLLLQLTVIKVFNKRSRNPSPHVMHCGPHALLLQLTVIKVFNKEARPPSPELMHCGPHALLLKLTVIKVFNKRSRIPSPHLLHCGPHALLLKLFDQRTLLTFLLDLFILEQEHKNEQNYQNVR
jgi:hypothetical protein